MANDESALREVDQDLDEERQWARFQKYGPAAIAGAVLLVAGVAGWQIYNAQRDAAAKEQSLELRNALELMAENPQSGREDLAAIAQTSNTGVGVLAQFHRAASFARNGERLSAIEAYRDIYNKSATPKRLKTLARLRAAYLSIADGRDAVFKDLGDLEQSPDTFGYYAKEISGIAAIQEKDFETAIAIFEGLANDIAAPEAISQRAKEFKAHAETGKAGVNISGDLQVDDLLGAIEEGVDGLGDHAGHDHGEEGHIEDELLPEEASSNETTDEAEPSDGGVEEPAGAEIEDPAADNTQSEDSE